MISRYHLTERGDKRSLGEARKSLRLLDGNDKKRSRIIASFSPHQRPRILIAPLHEGLEDFQPVLAADMFREARERSWVYCKDREGKRWFRRLGRLQVFYADSGEWDGWVRPRTDPRAHPSTSSQEIVKFEALMEYSLWILFILVLQTRRDVQAVVGLTYNFLGIVTNGASPPHTQEVCREIQGKQANWITSGCLPYVVGF
jgi:hypothetical protein